MAVNDPDNPAKKAAATKAAAVKKPPAPRGVPSPVNDPQATRPAPKLSVGGHELDPVKYPGLVTANAYKDPVTGQGYEAVNVGTYAAWLRDLPQLNPFVVQLIGAYGAPFQSMAWNAYITGMDQNTFLNQIRARFPDFESKLTAVNGPPGSRGGSRGGGGGGGGVANPDPTPEQIAAAAAAVRNRAGELGHVALTPDELTWVATTVVRDGWNSAQLDDWLLGDPTKVTEPGLVTASVDQIRQMAANQLLTVSDATARGWADRINSGEMTTDAVQSIFQQQAVGEFGWAAESIKAGINMKDMLAPARDQIAKELELTPNAVDLMDPKWRGMVTTTDDKTGAVRAATLTEVTRSARKAPEWANTNSSKSLAANTFMLVRQAFEG